MPESKKENEQLKEDLNDLQLLYESTLDHANTIEEELAQKNDALEATQKRLRKELDQAALYVMSLFPQKIHTGILEADWAFVPSTELGGDSFGYHFIDVNNLAIYLLDVCGHGVGAALLSATAINVLRSAALPVSDFRDPGAVLTALNKTFQMDSQNNMYFTIWYGCYNLKTKQLRYASGGHPPALLVRKSGEVQKLSTPQMIIGAIEDTTYTANDASVESGDSLFLFSDGVFEVPLKDGHMLSFDAFFELFQKNRPQSPTDFLHWIQSIQGHDTFDDDFSLLQLKF
ncbi:MAG: hypothetical protein A2Y14_02615 [Verrucomicrobia bacterium GWF2_51_19]|nr:MAG: hypothetical protein A2Y14_02615 [Verrucomicrobia bacterium GWF2_51_19]HCJ11619.1 regulator [Opitutae bacterium]